VLGLTVSRRQVWNGGGLENRVVHDAAIRGRIRGWWADGLGAVAPDLLELGRRDISAVVRSDGRPELLATSLVDGTESVSIDNAWLVGNLSVDTETVVGLGRTLGCESTRLGKENLVLAAA
jgi:hypothetical protein